MASVDGLISGLNTTTIIAELMAIERLPEAQLTDGKTTSQTLVSTLQSLNALITSMQTAATAFVPDTITKQSAWTSTTATSSNSTLASALTGVGALPGISSFTVTSVASAGSAVSSGTVGSLDTVVAGGPFMVSRGAARLGLSAIDAGATLTPGAHTVEVTQSSAGATLTGSVVSDLVAMPPAVTITDMNNIISLNLDGVSKTITLNAGTYSPIQLEAEILRASGGAIVGSVSSSGSLQLATAREGSSASLQLAGVNTYLGLNDNTALASYGVDGIIALDGVAKTVSSAGAGDQLTLAGVGTDSVTATLAGGLRKGVATTSAVTVAAGATLSQVVTALNGAGTGVSATAVQVADGAYRLQVTSTTTGSASDVTLGSNAFSAGSLLGSMQQLSAGTDTVLRVGTGPGAFDVTSSTTTVSGLLPGVTITALKADPTTSITVNVASDTKGMADKMASMVAQANSVLSYIDASSAYDLVKKTGGPLAGDSMGRDLRAQITDAVIGSSSSTPAMSGVSVARDGNIAFDRAAFLAAYAKDPAAVTATMTTMSQQLSDMAKQASGPVIGEVTARVKNEQDRITGYTKQIADFEDRMTLRQQSLVTQYAALETMLGSLKTQSAWLTGILATLPNNTSTST